MTRTPQDSASIPLDITEGGRRRRLLFSGNIGPVGRVLLNDPAPPAGVDAVVMETTCDDRDHRSLDASVAKSYDAIPLHARIHTGNGFASHANRSPCLRDAAPLDTCAKLPAGVEPRDGMFNSVVEAARAQDIAATTTG